jgi:hypothetical protein
MYIKNQKIRKYLLLFLTYKKVEHLLDTLSLSQVMGIVEFVKRSNELQTLDLFSSVKITITIMNITYNYNGI